MNLYKNWRYTVAQNLQLVSVPEWQISVEGDTMSQIPVEA